TLEWPPHVVYSFLLRVSVIVVNWTHRRFHPLGFKESSQHQAVGDDSVGAGVEASHDAVLQQSCGFDRGEQDLDELLHRLEKIPHEQLRVHCEAGYRASVACALLDRAGHDVFCVDDVYSHAEELVSSPGR
ncbi:MAG: hypothetical protein WCC65_07315, partial [Pseudonocardiaceae bacterium]